jgi:hypothetical protein
MTFLMLDHRLNANFRNAARNVVVFKLLLVFKNYLGDGIHRRFLVKEMISSRLITEYKIVTLCGYYFLVSLLR